MEYVVVVEKAEDGSFSAYVPDLPGCVACGDTRAEAKRLIREAIRLHIESLEEYGDPVPKPTTSVYTVAV
jgi:predicted RNase H-like HicB family nuclease